jgi:predicted metal-dependent hydrolase
MQPHEKHERFERGLAHFNARRFFDAHEVWEEIWLVENEPEKTFLQGIIQIAAAFHHYLRENSDGAESLLAAGIVKISRFPADYYGLEVENLRVAAKWWARSLGESKKPDDREIPVILRSSSFPARSGPHATKQ